MACVAPGMGLGPRREFDVVVVGGGPAGSITARELACAGLRVALVERCTEEIERVGENLPAAARILLARLGLLREIERLEPLPAQGIRSYWGSPVPSESSSLFNAHGAGWHLDRLRFDQVLWEAAVEAGAIALRGLRIGRPQWVNGAWSLDGVMAGSPVTLCTRFLVDATGRAAWLSRQLGCACRSVDELCGLVFAFAESRCTHATVEAFEHGWWYSAPLPGGRHVSIAMLDASDLGDKRRASGLSWRAWSAGSVTGRLHDGRMPTERPRGWLAHSQITGLSAPRSWMPVGDAAMAFDPLSSLGLSFALASACEASQAITAYLASADTRPLCAYLSALHTEFTAYLETRRQVYRREQRWPRSRFWHSRHAAHTPLVTRISSPLSRHPYLVTALNQPSAS